MDENAMDSRLLYEDYIFIYEKLICTWMKMPQKECGELGNLFF